MVQRQSWAASLNSVAAVGTPDQQHDLFDFEVNLRAR